jgi:hypothetical protein
LTGNCGDGGPIAFGGRIADDIDRVRVRSGRRQRAAQCRERRRRELGRNSAAVDQLIKRQHPSAAAIGDDADAVVRQRRETGGDFGGVEQLVEAPTRRMPARRSAASITRSAPASAPVWVAAARAAVSSRPGISAITGMRRSATRAVDLNVHARLTLT